MTWFSELATQKIFLKTLRRDPHLIYLEGAWAGRRLHLSFPAVAELQREFYVVGPERRWMVSVAATPRQFTATPIKLRQGRTPL